MESMWCLFLILKNHMIPLGKVEIFFFFKSFLFSFQTQAKSTVQTMQHMDCVQSV